MSQEDLTPRARRKRRTQRRGKRGFLFEGYAWKLHDKI